MIPIWPSLFWLEGSHERLQKYTFVSECTCILLQSQSQSLAFFPPTPHVKLWRQINTKTPFKITISSDKDGIRQQAIFRIFYFIINRSDNALVHMTLRHIALSNNTKKYIRGMKGLVHSNIDTCTKHERFLKALLLF